MKKYLTNLAENTMWLFIGSFFVMLLIGVAHDTDPRIPALGYGTIFTLLAALNIARDARK